jgi:ABC transport system ATP-binding/permease protein
MLKLIIQDDEGKTTVVPLIRDEITIGRKEGNTIRLTERNVSRRHARIIRSNGSVLIEDLDSYNGIRVNGTRIAGRVKVAESDRIQIGDYLLELKVDRGAQADPFDSQATQPIEKIDSAAVTAPVPGAGAAQPISPASLAAAAVVPTEPQAIVPAIADDSKPKPRISGTQPGVTPAVEPVAAMPPVSAPVSQAIATDAPARLVVLSANFAGREFVLDKGAMVIGRTEDNDIVVNHRSISRHHAKIVKEHGRYSIVDLQSSNGVRVNGEEYGKVELRRGDLVDLGHVRIRFIEPGEDFIYDRDAPALRASAEIRRSRAPLVAVLGVVVAAGVAAFFVLGRDKTPSDTAGENPESTGAAPIEPIKPNPSPTPTVVPAAPNDTVKKKIDAAQANLDARKWSAAIADADEALKLSPDDGQAKALKERAQAELADQKLKEVFDRAAAKGDLKQMYEVVKKMNQTTTTYQEASAKQLKAAGDNGREIIARAVRYGQAGKCDQVRRLTPSEWESTPVQREKVEELFRECQKNQVASRDPKETPRNPDPPNPNPNPTPPPQNNAQAAAALLQDAKLAYSAKQYQKALGKSEDALDASPGDQEAMSIAGMAACKLHNIDVANKYLKRLKAQRQTLVRQICLGEKVPVSDDKP